MRSPLSAQGPPKAPEPSALSPASPQTPPPVSGLAAMGQWPEPQVSQVPTRADLGGQAREVPVQQGPHGRLCFLTPGCFTAQAPPSWLGAVLPLLPSAVSSGRGADLGPSFLLQAD